ncbi:MAG: hypothetical protein G01um10147_856 [Microgenomates group bacterium Gr01-1014_7]|nr:MAG: hypothetical protein G01um10147_856 [Microgenomates group bacterium Gr01-1014_7]
MDNNQPVQPVTPQAAILKAPVTVSQTPAGGRNKLWFVAVGVVVLLIIAGVYWYLTIAQKGKGSAKKEAVTAGGIETLEKDVNAIKIENGEEEFSTVDEDLQSL